MKRTKTLGLVSAGAALAIAAAISAPTAIAAVGGSHAKSVAPVGVDSIVTGPPVDVEPGTNGFASVTCPTKVTGGGGTTSSVDIFFTDSYPSSAQTWAVRGTNTGAFTQRLTAWAVCKR